MLTFRSTELQREIEIGSVHDLQLEEVRRFHVELTLAVHTMDDSIREAYRLENEAGVLFDRDWMHKARKKRRITLAFATEAKRCLMKLEGIDGGFGERRSLIDVQREKFMQMKQSRLRSMLAEELGPGVYEEIENDAHEEAEIAFKAWLKENSYQQFYVT
jgi:hypothetical protein